VNAFVGTWVMYAGMAISMIGGAPWPRPNWVVVAAGVAVVIVGIVLKRRADARDPRVLAAYGEGAAVVHGSVAAAGTALPRMLAAVQALKDDVADAKLADLAQRIEKIQSDGTEQVAAAQDALTRAYTFQGYASVMGPLATAERYLYRAWSAASDGHRPEVTRSIEAAIPYLEEADTTLKSLTK